MSTAEASQKTPAFMSESRSQLSAEHRFIEVDGDSLVYRRFGNAQADAAALLCLQPFAATSTTGTRRSWIVSPRIAKSSCSVTAAWAPRAASFPTT
jgi:hypothetical protein